MARNVDWDSTIERVFRFLEMLIVISLLGVAIGIVAPIAAIAMTVVLSFAAGIYLSRPATRAWLRVRERKLRKDSELMGQMRAGKVQTFASWRFVNYLVSGVITTELTLWLQIVISSTVQVDTEAFRSAYERRMSQKAVADCVYAAARAFRDPAVCDHVRQQNRQGTPK